MRLIDGNDDGQSLPDNILGIWAKWHTDDELKFQYSVNHIFCKNARGYRH